MIHLEVAARHAILQRNAMVFKPLTTKYVMQWERTWCFGCVGFVVLPWLFAVLEHNHATNSQTNLATSNVVLGFPKQINNMNFSEIRYVPAEIMPISMTTMIEIPGRCHGWCSDPGQVTFGLRVLANVRLVFEVVLWPALAQLYNRRAFADSTPFTGLRCCLIVLRMNKKKHTASLCMNLWRK